MVWSLNPSTVKAQNSKHATEVVQTIEQQNQDLCQNSDSNDCELLQYKYCKMGDSAFPFYRATNYLFWKDFANDNRLQEFGNKKTKTWILGDLHVDNFGTFDNSEGKIVFNMNDFDESVIADYQYDVWRMAASMILVARNSGLETFAEDTEKQEKIIDAFSESYLDTIASYLGNDKEVKTDFTLDQLDFDFSDLLEKNRAKNKQKKARKKMLGKWTNEEGNKLANQDQIDKKKLALIDSDLYEEIEAAISNYSKHNFQVKDIVQRLRAGLGSLGTPRYYVLIEGKTDEASADRILDVKRQAKPTAYDFLGSAWQNKNYAKLQAIAYKALINDADPYLGWIELSDGFYSIRERSPYKDGILAANLNQDQAFTNMAKLWGEILATAHARADKDYDSDLIAYSFEKQVDKLTDGHHEEFRALVREIAFEYADQVQEDYEAFHAALVPNDCSQFQ
ncbi:MAG: DUF2252 family protein [Xenococcus sp. MO_188.B8]|nr:DUF2252 family protein [Xenococcus sp. MO_188.B8]